MAEWSDIYAEEDTTATDLCFLCNNCVYEMSVRSKMCLVTHETLTERQIYDKVKCDNYTRYR